MTRISRRHRRSLHIGAIDYAAKLAGKISKCRGRLWLMPEPGRMVSCGTGNHPGERHTYFAVKLCEALNKEVWLDGFWFVAWIDWDWNTAQYRQIVAGFMDHDGDPQFVVDDDNLTMDEIETGFDNCIENCANAWNEWKQFMEAVGVTKEQTIQGSRGERSVDPTAAPELDPFML